MFVSSLKFSIYLVFITLLQEIIQFNCCNVRIFCWQRDNLLNELSTDYKLHFFCMCVFIPALFGVLVSLVVELEGNLGVQADAEVVVHHTLLRTLSTNTENT